MHLPFADGDWSQWSGWSKANINRIETRTRSCDNPAPANGGLQCTPKANTTVETIDAILVETETRPCPLSE